MLWDLQRLSCLSAVVLERMQPQAPGALCHAQTGTVGVAPCASVHVTEPVGGEAETRLPIAHLPPQIPNMLP